MHNSNGQILAECIKKIFPITVDLFLIFVGFCSYNDDGVIEAVDAMFS